jgi:hypothetical protein
MENVPSEHIEAELAGIAREYQALQDAEVRLKLLRAGVVGQEFALMVRGAMAAPWQIRAARRRLWPPHEEPLS